MGMVYMRICKLEGCGKPAYGKTWCRSHYEQNRRGTTPHLIVHTWELGPCLVTECDRQAKNVKLKLCQQHAYQSYRGSKIEDMKKVQARGGFTENGRVCHSCGEDKPLTEYYRKNVGKRDNNYSGSCKPCYIARQLERHRARLLGDVS